MATIVGSARLADDGRQRGSVTAELALALPAVVLVLLLVLTAGNAAISQMRCTDAARAAARAAALGEDQAQIAAIVTDLAGPSATIVLTERDGWVRVRVSRPVAAGWWGSQAPQASAEVTIPIEPGEP